jgi:hypothetical protein
MDEYDQGRIGDTRRQVQVERLRMAIDLGVDNVGKMPCTLGGSAWLLQSDQHREQHRAPQC